MPSRSQEDRLALAKLRRLLAPTILLAVFGLGEPFWYAWIAQEPISLAPYVGGIGTLVMFALLRIVKDPELRTAEVPPETHRRLNQALEEQGLDGVRLQYGDRGVSADFPRPLIFGTNLMISRRVLDEFSSEALLWSIRTDALASVRFLRYGMPTFVAMLLLALVVAALGERVHAPGSFFALPVTIGILSFAVLGVSGYLFQILSDRRFTRTPADFEAAREALLIPYLAQRRQSRGKRWIFFLGELRGRARRLGIDLDGDAKSSNPRPPASS